MFSFLGSTLALKKIMVSPLSQPASISAATCQTRVSLKNTSEVVDWSHDSQFKKGNHLRKLSVMALMVCPRRQSHGPSILIHWWSWNRGSSESPVTASVFSFSTDAEREGSESQEPYYDKDVKLVVK